MPPPDVAELPIRVQSGKVATPPAKSPPADRPAVLPVTVQRVSVAVPPQKRPPPSPNAALPATVQSVSVARRPPLRPPPSVAELFIKAQRASSTEPVPPGSLKRPPPPFV